MGTPPPRVTFSAVPLIGLKIRGEKRDFPTIPNDGGITAKFMKWMSDNDIHPFIRQYTGGGGCLVFFEADDFDLDALKAVLTELGAIEDDIVTWESR